MKAPGDMEIVLKVKANGDFTVESSSRETYRVFKALVAAAQEINRGMNAKKGRLMLPRNYADAYEMNGN